MFATFITFNDLHPCSSTNNICFFIVSIVLFQLLTTLTDVKKVCDYKRNCF